MKLSGTLPAGEALIAGAALSRRLFGWRRFGFWIYMAILVATATTWFALPGTVGLDESLAGLGFGISVMLIMYGYVRWCRGLGSKGWARLGAFPQIDQSYEAGDVASGRTRRRPVWLVRDIADRGGSAAWPSPSAPGVRPRRSRAAGLAPRAWLEGEQVDGSRRNRRFVSAEPEPRRRRRARLFENSKGVTLGDVTLRELIHEGRRG
jgi:hypothetical protein